MGWHDFGIALRPTSDRPPTRTADEVHRALWSEGVMPLLQRVLKGRAYHGTVRGGYLSSQSVGGFSTRKWDYANGALWFRFFDAKGLFALDAVASVHFTEVALALLSADAGWASRLEGDGWRLEPARDAEAAMRDASVLLIALENVLYAVDPPSVAGEPPRVWTHQRGVQRPFASLTAPERALVTACAAQRRCACALCEHGRKLIAPAKPRKSATARAKRAP